MCSHHSQTYNATHKLEALTDTQHRQQGHVAHNRNTLDSRPQSQLVLPSFPLSMPSPFLPLSAVTQNIIFMNFSYAQLRALSALLSFLAMSYSASYLSQLLSPSHVLSLSLSALSSCFLFALLLLWVSVLRCYFSVLFFLFLFFGVQYIYISDVRNKRNLYIQ